MRPEECMLMRYTKAFALKICLKYEICLKYVPDPLKTQQMRVEAEPWSLIFIPDHLMTQVICVEALRKETSLLHFILDWFVRPRLVDMRHDDENYCDENRLAVWYNGYKQYKE